MSDDYSIKPGDKVVVIKGPDKGTVGTVTTIHGDVVGVATADRPDGSWVMPPWYLSGVL
jgi:transcription elongation factor